MVYSTKQSTNWYQSSFEDFEKSLDGKISSPFHEVRRAALLRFAQLGFPTKRDEEWKHTDITPLVTQQFSPVLNYRLDGLTNKDLEPFTFEHPGWNRIVFVNGHFSNELSLLSSLPPGTRMESLASAMRNNPGVLTEHLTHYARYDTNAFTALSTAFLRDGAFVYIPEGAIIENPLHVLFLATELGAEFVSHPRNLIVTGRNSQVSILECHVSLASNTYFSNAVAEIVLGENSVIKYTKFQNESDHSFHVGTTHVHQSRNSNFISNSISLGGALVRNDVTAVLDGEGVECTLNGLYVAAGGQHVDNHTTIDHAKPNCNSRELYKGILAGKSRGVFNGKILVRKDAQKTDAKQTNKNLVLSDNASIDTKPQLEIFANDVKCTHGATVGQLDEEAMFYLRSRGIQLDDARSILIHAFASDVINLINVEAVRLQLNQMLSARVLQEG